MVFWNNAPHLATGEWWVTPEKFEEKNLRIKELQEQRLSSYNAHPRRYRRGDHRAADDKIFWGYTIGSAGFEWWVTPTQYEKAMSRIRKRDRTIEATRQRKDYKRERRAVDPYFKLRGDISALISRTCSNHGYIKKSKALDILGCSHVEFMDHIECQFEECMFFDNHGEWELDHILPVSAASTEEEVILLNHYTNFQPMWATENKSKQNKHCPKALADYLENHPTKKPQVALRAIPAAWVTD